MDNPLPLTADVFYGRPLRTILKVYYPLIVKELDQLEIASDLFGLQVKLPRVTTSLTTQR